MPDFDAVDAGEDIDAVGGEDAECAHVEIVEPGDVDEGGAARHVGDEEIGHDNRGYAEIDIVDEEEWK